MRIRKALPMLALHTIAAKNLHIIISLRISGDITILFTSIKRQRLIARFAGRIWL